MLKNQNKNLKAQLKKFSNQIENLLDKKKNFNHNSNSSETEKYLVLDDFIKLQKEIKKYKESINRTNQKMETSHNYNKIKRLENEISLKKEKLELYKKENSTLNSIHRNIKKSEPNRSEFNILNYKLRKMKNELKYSKESLNFTENKLKLQIKHLIGLDEKNKRIKECMEIESNKKNIINDENSLEELSERIKFLESNINRENKIYREKINKLNSFILNLNDDIAKIKLRIKGTEQKIKIEEMKYKELLKLKQSYKSPEGLRIGSNPQSPNLNLDKFFKIIC